MRLAIVGASGFVGSAAARKAEELGHVVTRATAPRLTVEAQTVEEVRDSLAEWRSAHATEHRKLVNTFEGCDAVVNCAGLAVPDAPRRARLTGANAALPNLLYEAATRASVPTFVHVSSAAVQGRRPSLDERFVYDIRNPYAESKALGELALRQHQDADTELRIYRATSVQDLGRGVTDRLLALAHGPVVVVPGQGDQPLPFATRPNTAAAIVHTAVAERLPAVVLHPWEGITVERFFRLTNPESRRLRVPVAPLRIATEALWSVGRCSSSMPAIAKRADLMVLGQRSSAHALQADGFELPHTDAAYEELGRVWRATRRAV